MTHGPWLALFTAAFLRLLRIDRPLLAFTFNHGNGRFFSGPFLTLARRVLPSVAAFVTHSEYERQIFVRLYRIPEERIHFTHWAVAPPEINPDASQSLGQDSGFVCCIGRNNRDLPTFIEAVRRSAIPGIIVCGAGQIADGDLPSNLTVLTDIPKAKCDAIMAMAFATVVPLRDDSTGAGHMTIVTSLLLGTPVIATDSPVVTDYIREGETGLLVKRGSAQALTDAFIRLRDEPGLHSALAEGGRRFAQDNLTEAVAVRFLRGLLEAQAVE